MKRRKRMGMPPARPPTLPPSSTSSSNAGEVGAMPLAGNTIALFAARLNIAGVQSAKTPEVRREVDSHAARVMSAAELGSERLQREQDKFDAELAKLPNDKFVKGISNLMKKYGRL